MSRLKDFPSIHDRIHTGYSNALHSLYEIGRNLSDKERQEVIARVRAKGYLKRLEAKIVEGPYIHHCVGIHENVVPVLYEACKYIGIAPDLYDPIEEDVKAYLRGE